MNIILYKFNYSGIAKNNFLFIINILNNKNTGKLFKILAKK